MKLTNNSDENLPREVKSLPGEVKFLPREVKVFTWWGRPGEGYIIDNSYIDNNYNRQQFNRQNIDRCLVIGAFGTDHVSGCYLRSH